MTFIKGVDERQLVLLQIFPGEDHNSACDQGGGQKQNRKQGQNRAELALPAVQAEKGQVTAKHAQWRSQCNDQHAYCCGLPASLRHFRGLNQTFMLSSSPEIWVLRVRVPANS